MNRKHITKLLMCRPTHFSELDFVINPWMQPGTIDQVQTIQQWGGLVKLYESLGIQVKIIEQEKGVPDMVFAADQGVVRGNRVIFSRFITPERRGESAHYEKWFREHGYEIQKLPDDCYFEGNGDSFFCQDKLLIGVGYRADQKTCDVIAQLLNCEVVPLQIADPRFYHIDVGFLPLDEETAFYYPQAFTEAAQKQLQKIIPNLLELTEEEVNGFSANSVVSGNHVILQAGNPTFEKKLKDLEYLPVAVDLSEFKKSGGGTHCLTNVLEDVLL
jgi:arginine dihydrolase